MPRTFYITNTSSPEETDLSDLGEELEVNPAPSSTPLSHKIIGFKRLRNVSQLKDSGPLKKQTNKQQKTPGSNK